MRRERPTSSRARPGRLAVAAITSLIAATAVLAVAGPAAATPPPTPNFAGVPVEGYASQPDHFCLGGDPHRAGVDGVRELLLDAYPNSMPGATWAPCDTHASNSDHHTGRALDWHPGAAFTEPSPAARADGDEVANWLLATVDGVPHMRLRRLGIVYIIWNNQIWSTSSRAWRQYQSCSGTSGNPTTCHRDHIHLSFGAAGADGLTSWWDGAAAPPQPSERKGGSGGLAASWGVGRLDVFGRGGGGSVYHNYHDRGGQSWPGWGPLSGSGGTRSRPVTVSWGSGRLDVFAVGADQKMKHWWFDRAGDNRWRGPETLGDTTFAGTPTVVTYDPGRIDVFARDTNNQLRHNYVVSGGTVWPGWEVLGSDLGGDPAVVSWHAARWDVFAIGSDRRMKHWWFDRLGESRWRGPEVIGTGTFAGTPAAVSWEPGRIDLFARDEAGRLRHNYVQSGAVTWPAWENWGGDISSNPVAVTWQFGRLDVFAVDAATDRMGHWWFDRAGDNSWRGPEELGDTTFSSAISAVAWAPGRLDVFGIDTNNTMRHNGFERGVTGWTGWQHLGGTFQP